MRSWIIVLVAALAPATAAAYPLDPDVDADPYRARDHELRPELGFGFLVGEYSVGKIAGTTFGFHLDAGVRLHRIAALAEYDFLSLKQDTSVNLPVRGLIHRVGVTVRYSFGVLSMRNFPVRGDFWFEAGVGRQRISWYDGGILHRNDVSFGLAGQGSVRFGGDRKAKKIGLYYAVKFLIADRPDVPVPPSGCAGPCDEPSPMIPVDLGIFFNVGVPFGG